MAAPLRVVAAENVYGDIAAQLGGDAVSVVSVLNNPAQDPHLFEASASVARAVADAELVIYNGADYDPWMAKLLSVGGGPRATIVAADLAHKAAGDNPHLWYDLAIAGAVADAVAQALSKSQPASADAIEARRRGFHDRLKTLTDMADAARSRDAGLPVAATEPVFEYAAQALGLEMRDVEFQRAIMNGTEPSARAVAAFESDLTGHKVKALIYNKQSTSTLCQRMRALAEAAKIPVVAVTEMEPAGTTYQSWVMAELTELDQALSGPAR